jgi:hypothetical protein
MTASKTPAPVVTGHETDIHGNVIYSVPSRTSTDIYLVVENNGEIVCCCKGYQYRHHCAHLDAIAAYKRRIAKLINKDLPPARKSA